MKMTEFYADDNNYERLFKASHYDERIGLLLSSEQLELIGKYATDKFIIRNCNNARMLFEKRFRIIENRLQFTIYKVRSE